MGRTLAAGASWEKWEGGKEELQRFKLGLHLPPYCPFILRTMAHLYGDPEWSQKDLEGPIKYAREHLTKSKMEAFSPERLASYHQELELRAEQGHPTTFVDLWALVLESMLHGQVGRQCWQVGRACACGAGAALQLAAARAHFLRGGGKDVGPQCLSVCCT